MSKIIFIDTETTGLDAAIHGMREIGIIVEIDGEVKESHCFYIDPTSYNKKIVIDPKALELSGKTLKDFESTNYQYSTWVFDKFITLLDKYIDKDDKNDKFKINGYNTQFDIGFIKEWFKDNDSKLYSSYFDYKSLDVFALVGFLRYKNLIETENDRLETICNHFNIPIQAHNALSDIKATKQLNDLLTSKYLNDKDRFAELEKQILSYYLSKGYKLEKNQTEEKQKWSFNVVVTTQYKWKYIQIILKDKNGDEAVFNGAFKSLKEMFDKAFEHFRID